MVKLINEDIIGAGDFMMLKEDIVKIANLAKLEIKNEEIPFYIAEMEKMLGFAENIIVDETDEFISRAEPFDFNDMREDVIAESFSNSDILSNANHSEESFFKLRKRA